MKKIFYFTLIIVAVVVIAWFLPFRKMADVPAFSNPLYPHADLAIGEEHFDAAVAETDALKEQGLSGWKGLEEHEAMLFPYEKPGNLPFWMKDMLFSIDIVWLDADKHIIYFQKNASPDSYPRVFSPSTFAQYVIELRAGTVDRISAKIGDEVTITPKK